MSSFSIFLHRLGHWEYWPLWAVYYPLFPIWLYYAIKAKSFYFFSACNPTIENGGMAMESKKDIYDLIPDAYIPKTILVQPNETAEEIYAKTQQANINFSFMQSLTVSFVSSSYAF